jgi:hypothetical protein
MELWSVGFREVAVMARVGMRSWTFPPSKSRHSRAGVVDLTESGD